MPRRRRYSFSAHKLLANLRNRNSITWPCCVVPSSVPFYEVPDYAPQGEICKILPTLNPTKHFTELQNQREVFGRLIQCHTELALPELLGAPKGIAAL